MEHLVKLNISALELNTGSNRVLGANIIRIPGN